MRRKKIFPIIFRVVLAVSILLSTAALTTYAQKKQGIITPDAKKIAAKNTMTGKSQDKTNPDQPGRSIPVNKEVEKGQGFPGTGIPMQYITILVLFILIPFIVDLICSHCTKKSFLKDIQTNITSNKLTQEERKEITELGLKSFYGTVGLARSLMAIGVILTLGISLFHLISFGFPVDNSPDGKMVINNVLSMMGGLLAAITGFYFGSKKSEQESELKGKNNKKNKKVTG